MTEGKDLLQVLWSGADVLRGKMDANEYKTYLLGLVFYKYLSDSYLSKAYDLMNDEKPDSLEEAQECYEEVMESEDAKDLLEELKESLHYTLDSDMTYVSMLKSAKNNSFNRENSKRHLTGFRSQTNCLMGYLRMLTCIQIVLEQETRNKVQR